VAGAIEAICLPEEAECVWGPAASCGESLKLQNLCNSLITSNLVGLVPPSNTGQHDAPGEPESTRLDKGETSLTSVIAISTAFRQS
jgi:hypothetical protein